MKRNLTACLIGGMAAVVALAAPRFARAQENPGKVAYIRYCGACHGASGKGDGFAGTFIRPKPTDLTQLAKKAGGKFPTMQVMKIIDGRQEVGAHGKAEMPVWGEIFREEGPNGGSGETRVRGKVALITDYLRTIQAK